MDDARRIAELAGLPPETVGTVRELLPVLTGWHAKRVLWWLQAVNVRLGGVRPRELIATEPERVVRAAVSFVESATYCWSDFYLSLGPPLEAAPR